MRRIREALHKHQESDGLTLLELLISMIIFSIAISMVYTVLIMVQKKSTATQQSSDVVTQLRAGLEDIDKQVRSGNVLYTPANEGSFLSSCSGVTNAAGDSGNCMRVFTQTYGNSLCVQWQVLPVTGALGPNILRTRSWATDWAMGGIRNPWHTVAHGLTMSASSYPFSTPPAAGQYGQRLLTVSFTALDPRSGKAVTVSSALSGRNTTYGYDAQLCGTPPP
jgi:prepilin-type N-terminal cleavage/methylation domain-containing protein